MFNPTIINVHYKDAANFASYREPRGFNELIPKTEVVSKVKKLSQPVEAAGYRLAMHPSQEAFIVYSGTIAYIMELELGNSTKLSSMFDKSTCCISRFCFSIDRLNRFTSRNFGLV